MQPSDKVTTKLETRLLSMLPLLDTYMNLKGFYISEVEVLKYIKAGAELPDEDKRLALNILKHLEHPTKQDKEKERSENAPTKVEVKKSHSGIYLDSDLSLNLHNLMNKYLVDHFTHILVLKQTFSKIEFLMENQTDPTVVNQADSARPRLSRHLQALLEDLVKYMNRYPSNMVLGSVDEYPNLDPYLLSTHNASVESKFRLVVSSYFNDL